MSSKGEIWDKPVRGFYQHYPVLQDGEEPAWIEYEKSLPKNHEEIGLWVLDEIGTIGSDTAKLSGFQSLIQEANKHHVRVIIAGNLSQQMTENLKDLFRLQVELTLPDTVSENIRQQHAEENG